MPYRYPVRGMSFMLVGAEPESIFCHLLPCHDLQEVLKGDKYNASIAWLPADTTADAAAADRLPASKQQPPAVVNGYSSSSGGSSQPQIGGSNSSSVVIDSAALQEAAAAGSSAGPGQLPVSSARVASVTAVQPDRFPGPSVGLQDFPGQGMCGCECVHGDVLAAGLGVHTACTQCHRMASFLVIPAVCWHQKVSVQ